jgi:DNA mismatch repair protein MutS
MGSFVPAASARIGVVDKIFTRIGAHDEITKGQSTFMVEMTEAADILNNLTPKSLVILDEIGRGTSTYDGLSLAWSLAEHLQRTKAKTLFATHFHELTALANDYPGVKNYNVAVKEWEDEIIFLHKIVPGSTDDSYGIYVAKLAGIPNNVIDRAKKILTKIELNQDIKEALSSGNKPAPNDEQLDFFVHTNDPVAEELKKEIERTDLENMTPIEALGFLNTLKKKIDNRV